MQPATSHEQTCPFCGLACDDLALQASASGIEAGAGACARALALYRQVGAPTGAAQAWVDGQPVALEAALARATSVLQASHAPLFAGLSTDVQGMRGLLELADRTGAVLDHMNSEGKLRNLRTVQDTGWITTTLSEVRNRADLVVCFGSEVVPRFPRFFDRCVWVDDALFAPPARSRQVIVVGPSADAVRAGAPDPAQVDWIDVPVARLPEVAALLRGLAAGSLPPQIQTDLPLAALQALVARLQAAQYATLVWVAADLDVPQGDLCVQSLAALLGTLNQTGRAAGLPLGGSDGDFSADAVMLWQTGYPYRTSLASGTGRYEPVLNATSRLLASHDVDSLLWVGCFDPARLPPPHEGIPLVAFTCAGTPVLADAIVQITVATPGIDTAGYYFRADKVVALPLRPLQDRSLPTVQQLARQLLDHLAGPPAGRRDGEPAATASGPGATSC